jgi:hypothetical protein
MQREHHSWAGVFVASKTGNKARDFAVIFD